MASKSWRYKTFVWSILLLAFLQSKGLFGEPNDPSDFSSFIKTDDLGIHNQEMFFLRSYVMATPTENGGKIPVKFIGARDNYIQNNLGLSNILGKRLTTRLNTTKYQVLGVVYGGDRGGVGRTAVVIRIGEGDLILADPVLGYVSVDKFMKETKKFVQRVVSRDVVIGFDFSNNPVSRSAFSENAIAKHTFFLEHDLHRFLIRGEVSSSAFQTRDPISKQNFGPNNVQEKFFVEAHYQRRNKSLPSIGTSFEKLTSLYEDGQLPLLVEKSYQVIQNCY